MSNVTGRAIGTVGPGDVKKLAAAGLTVVDTQAYEELQKQLEATRLEMGAAYAAHRLAVAEAERQRAAELAAVNALGQAEYERDQADAHASNLAWTLDRLRAAARAVLASAQPSTEATVLVDRAAVEGLENCVSSKE